MKSLLMALVAALAITAPSSAAATTAVQRAHDLAYRAVTEIDDAHHDVLGHSTRCFRVRGRGTECGFAVVVRYEDGAVRTCVGSIVVRRHRARFRPGLSCAPMSPVIDIH